MPEASVEDAVQDVFLVDAPSTGGLRGTIVSQDLALRNRVTRGEGLSPLPRSRQAHKVERTRPGSCPSAPAAAQTPIGEAERREANQVLHAILAELNQDHREISDTGGARGFLGARRRRRAPSTRPRLSTQAPRGARGVRKETCTLSRAQREAVSMKQLSPSARRLFELARGQNGAGRAQPAIGWHAPCRPKKRSQQTRA